MINLIKLVMGYILSYEVNTIQFILNEVYQIIFYLSILISVLLLFKKLYMLRGSKLLKIIYTNLEIDWEGLKHLKY